MANLPAAITAHVFACPEPTYTRRQRLLQHSRPDADGARAKCCDREFQCRHSFGRRIGEHRDGPRPGHYAFRYSARPTL